MMSLEIYFRDLNEGGKKKVLEFFKVEREEDANLEAFPLLIIEESEELSESETYFGIDLAKVEDDKTLKILLDCVKKEKRPQY